jgi:hypothetical protein
VEIVDIVEVLSRLKRELAIGKIEFTIVVVIKGKVQEHHHHHHTYTLLSYTDLFRVKNRHRFFILSVFNWRFNYISK